MKSNFNQSLKVYFKVSLLMILLSSSIFAQKTERPMIWVKPSDKALILDKITKNQWAKDYFEAFKDRADKELAIQKAEAERKEKEFWKAQFEAMQQKNKDS